jgi:hypothetical protein
MSQAYGGAGIPAAQTRTEPSAWAVGWTLFAAIMMAIQGAWWFVSGLVGLVNDDFYVATSDYILQFNVTTWGWIHLVLGVVLFLAGIALFSGAVWARTIGVIVATVAMFGGFAWLPYFPFWAILFIVASAFVIWALTVHGRDVAAP